MPPFALSTLLNLNDGRRPRLHPLKSLKVPGREGGKYDVTSGRTELFEKAHAMPRRHVRNIRLRGDPLEPGVHSESEGIRLKRMKEASRVGSTGVAFNKC